MRFSTRAAPRGDVGTRGRGAFAKHDGAGVVRAGEDAIGRQDVKMYKATEKKMYKATGRTNHLRTLSW
jgi:hypothetical protein